MFPKVPQAAAMLAAHLAAAPSLRITTTDAELACSTGLSQRSVRRAVAVLRDLGAVDAPPRQAGRVRGAESSVQARVITRLPQHWLWTALASEVPA